MKAFLFLAAILAACGTCEACRLLVSVDSKVAFSAEEFAKASGAAFIQVDSRNPYLSFHDCFLETPYVVIEKNVNDQVPARRLAVRYGYRYQDISEGSLEEAIFQAEQKLSSTPKHPNEIDSLSDAEQNRLYALMGKIDTVLTKAGIQYWAGRQTLLGALYYQGLRPWDDYLHLFMLERDDKKLKELQEEFDKAGLVLHHYWKDFYKIFEKDGLALVDTYLHPGETLPFRYPAANLFVMTLEKRNESEDVYVHRSEHFYSYWNFDRFYYDQVRNITRAAFGSMMLPVPADSDSYLNRVFGLPGYPDLWRKYAQERDWNHRSESSVLSGACLVELERPL